MSIKTWILISLTFLSVIFIVILDSKTPLGYADWILYFLPVLISSLTNSKVFIYIATAITPILMTIGYFTSPPAVFSTSVAITNRISAFAVVCFVVFLTLKRMATIRRLEETQKNERKNREFLDVILNNINIAVAVMTGRDLKYVYVNPVYQSIVPNVPMLGKRYRDVFPQIAENTEQLILGVIDTGTPWNIERFHAPVPGKADAKWSGKVVPLGQISVSGEKSALIMIGDVTEWDTLEKQIRKREQEYSTLAAHAPEIIARFDRQFCYTYINEYGTKVYGIPSEQIIGKSIEELKFPRKVTESWKEHFKQVFTTGQMKIFNFEYESRDLGHLYLSSLLVPEFGKNKEVVSILTITRDITELKETEERLRESEKSFRELANSMPQLVWTADADGTVDYYNEKYKDFDGIAPLPGGKWKWGQAVHEDDMKATEDAWNNAVKTGKFYEIEHRVRHSDESYHWYLSRAVPVCNEKGEIIKWYGTATNIDRSKNALHDLEESERKLKILNENLENIVVQRTTQVRALSSALTLAEQRERKRISYVLHENLQQKLLGARLLLGQHLRDHELSKSEKDVYDDVEDSIGLLDNAINTARSLSIELNPPILQSQGLDTSLRWLVRHMKKAFGLEIEMKITGKVNTIRNEKQLMLTQMVRELLNNVIKHSGVRSAQIDAVYHNRHIEISVTDKGRGFNPEEALRRSTDDTRLSLLSIQERLRLFNGELEIQSSTGQGTKCTIKLPVNNH